MHGFTVFVLLYFKLQWKLFVRILAISAERYQQYFSYEITLYNLSSAQVKQKLKKIKFIITNLIYFKSQNYLYYKKKNFNVHVISGIIHIVNPKLPVKIFS